jgi:hypothetical protein
MFGLMRPKRQCSSTSCSCEQAQSAYLLHRQHYCGTCKAIGKTFDHKSRLLLNFDTVFLAELLSELNHQSTDTWEGNLQVVNTCFSMPKEDQLPFSLEYAAHTSALLGALKIDDNIKDSGRFRWKMIQQAYQKTFKKAYQQLETWGLDMSEIDQWIIRQVELEQKSIVYTDNIEEHLLHYAAPTATITSELFALGGKLLQNKSDLKALGLAFGQLIYILDAFEDYEKDVFEGVFNPLALFWPESRSLPSSALEQVRQLLLQLEQNINVHIGQLSISEAAKERFSGRLTSNLALRIYRERVIPKSLKERWALRWQQAKETAEQLSCAPTTRVRQMNVYMIAVAVFINPEAQNYLPEEGKWEVFQWSLLFTTILATLGLMPIVRKRRKQKRQERRERRRQRRLQRKANKLASSGIKNSFWSDCCGACCSGCCEGCCESCADSDCCSNCCENCCEEVCDDEDACLKILLIFLAVCLLAGLVLLILFLAGVI